MSDIVERLLHCSENCGDEYLHELTGKAADTITRLTAEVRVRQTIVEEARDERDAALAEVEKLRAALKEIAKPTYGTEFNMSDEDRADILGRHLFAKQDLARATLSGDKQ
jgi:hypothetical protein